MEQAEFPQIALGKNVPYAAEFTILLLLLLFNSLTTPALAVAVENTTVTNCRPQFSARLNITQKCFVHNKHWPARGLGMLI